MKIINVTFCISKILILNLSLILSNSAPADNFAFSSGKVINRQYYVSPQKLELFLAEKNKELKHQSYEKRIYFEEVNFDEVLLIAKGMQVGKIGRNEIITYGPLKNIYFSSNDLFHGLFIEFEGEEDLNRFDGLYVIYDKEKMAISVPKLTEIADEDVLAKDKEEILDSIIERTGYLKRQLTWGWDRKDISDDPIKYAKKNIADCYECKAWVPGPSSGMQKIIQFNNKSGKYCHEFAVVIFDNGEVFFIPDNTHVVRPNVRPFNYKFKSLFKMGNEYYIWLAWYASETGYHGDGVYRIDKKVFEEVFRDGSWST
jgi:hypothetical protein